MLIIFISSFGIAVILFALVCIFMVTYGGIVVPIATFLQKAVDVLFTIAIPALPICSVIYGIKKRTVFGGISMFVCISQLIVYCYMTFTTIFTCFSMDDSSIIIVSILTGLFCGGLFFAITAFNARTIISGWDSYPPLVTGLIWWGVLVALYFISQ